MKLDKELKGRVDKFFEEVTPEELFELTIRNFLIYVQVKQIEMTDDLKRMFLKENGWETLWNEDNWVHRVRMAGANLDYAGVSLNSAYNNELQFKKEVEDKIIEYGSKGQIDETSYEVITNYPTSNEL